MKWVRPFHERIVASIRESRVLAALRDAFTLELLSAKSAFRRPGRSWRVPEISRFFGIVITMFYNDHNRHTFTPAIAGSGRSWRLTR
jgi:hypothetical protein